MPRILGVDIPNNKKVEISLRYIYGIGPRRATPRHRAELEAPPGNQVLPRSPPLPRPPGPVSVRPSASPRPLLS